MWEETRAHGQGDVWLKGVPGWGGEEAPDLAAVEGKLNPWAAAGLRQPSLALLLSLYESEVRAGFTMRLIFSIQVAGEGCGSFEACKSVCGHVRQKDALRMSTARRAVLGILGSVEAALCPAMSAPAA